MVTEGNPVSDNLRQDIAGAIYDATGLRGEAWATASDVADEYVLADAVLAVVQPLVDERDRLKDEAVHYIAQRLALDEVAKHADALRVERDRLLWLHAEAVWNWRHLADRHDRALEREHALRASAVVLPEDWRERLYAQASCDSESRLIDRLVANLESWCPATVEAAPPPPLCEKCRCRGVHDADRPRSVFGHFCLNCIGACHDMSDESSVHMCVIDRWTPSAAGVSGTVTEASKAAAAPSPDVDREAIGRVIHDAQCICNGGHELQPDDLAAADALIAAGYVCAPGHEWQCPGCGATTRARMADYPTERDGAALIAAKRHAVIAKGRTPEHDDQHVHGELLDAARCYANQGRTWFPEFHHKYGTGAGALLDQGWPWWTGEVPEGWRPSGDPIENLANAGQLIAAEIDRLQRAARGDLS